MTPDQTPAPSRRRMILLCRIGFFLAAAIALGAALVPSEDNPPELFGWDKADHLAVFAGLMVLAAAAFPAAPIALLGLFLVLFGGAIELLQGLPLVHRDSDILDVLADSLGLVLAAAPAVLAQRLTRPGRRRG